MEMAGGMREVGLTMMRWAIIYRLPMNGKHIGRGAGRGRSLLLAGQLSALAPAAEADDCRPASHSLHFLVDNAQ